MLHIETGVNRRGFLQTSVALGAFMLPQIQRPILAANRRRAGRAKSVIVLLLEGGKSHLDSWDPKPDAPAEIRGGFAPIPTNNLDLIVGEHMPRLARQAHLYNVVRSVYMDNARRDHSPGLHWILTGYDNQAAGVSLMATNNYPSVGAILSKQRGSATQTGLPNFVAIPNGKQLGGRVKYTGAMHLGADCDAFDSGTVPTRANERYVLPAGLTLPADVPVSRLQDRRRLLDSLSNLDRQLAQSGGQGMTEYQHRACDLLTGRGGLQAFDLNQEPISVRERYGNSAMGQGTLLARRLVEAGVTYVLVNYSKNNSWDTHANNFNRLQRTLLPPMDQASSALLADLEQRGMLDDVLVLMTGEMGRTPRINNRQGRDHWPDVFSLMIAGGGLTRGQILGASTRFGERPGSRPVHFNEILATVYHQLGIDQNLMIRDRQDRPVRIQPEAAPVHELISGS